MYTYVMFGASLEGRPTKIVGGYYCQRLNLTADFISDLLQAISFKGEASAIKPSGQNVNSVAGPRREVARLNKPEPVAQVPFAASWDGYTSLLLGEMEIEQGGGQGGIRLDLPDGSAKCSGLWKWTSGKYGTAALPTGTWSLACSNGMAAAGTYTSSAAAKGTGAGTDAQGRAVKITFGR